METTTDSVTNGSNDVEVHGVAIGDESPRIRDYFDLRDALVEPGCPLCARVFRAGEEALAALVREAGRATRDRKHTPAFRTLCNTHAWNLRAMPPKPVRLAEAHEGFLYGRIEALQWTIARLRRRSHMGWLSRIWTRGWGGLDSSPRWRRIRRCPACRAAEVLERRDLGLLLDLITDMEFARAFESSRGLCLPHLGLAIRLAPDHPNLSRLMEAHLPKIKRIQADLQDFIRRAKAPRPTLTEADEDAAWDPVLEWMAGKAGVFGPERRLGSQGEGWLASLVRAWRSTRRGAAQVTGDNGGSRPMDEVERLSLENAKLQRRLVEVSREWAEESARRAALQFQVHKLSEDVKVLELNLAGARGGAESGELHAQRLREAIQALRDEIRRLRGEEGNASNAPGGGG